MVQQNTVYSLLRAVADVAPEAPALLGVQRQALSYGQLIELIEQTAGTLAQLGIGRGENVAMVLRNGPEAATCFLSITAAATSAPLNPGYSTSELQFYLADLKPKALIVDSEGESPVIAVAESLGIPLLRLVRVPGDPAGKFRLETSTERTSDLPTSFAVEDDVALVLHTSGSTSRPKMVPLTQRNLCFSARNIRDSLQLTKSDKSLNIMPLFHIHGLIGAVLSQLAAGGTVVCTPGFDPAKFVDWLEEFHPTWYTGVPTMHQSIVRSMVKRGRPSIAANLRFIRSCSSALAPKTMEQLESTFSVPVVEAYGMTEASHQIAINRLPPGTRKPGSVGLPTGCEIAIVDDHGTELARGQSGHIAIRGPNVTLGYANNPEANAASFFGEWLNTGDQGSLDSDGYVYLSGRTKEIINRGGEKISPREIDEVFMEHPAVAQAIAFAIPDERLGEDIAVAVVQREGAGSGEQLESELRTFISQRLADFKVPRRIVFVPAIPNGPTGKPQRIGLADKLALLGSLPSSLEKERSASSKSYTATEQRLTGIWQKLLDVQDCGRDNDFFDLGGDSLLAGQLVIWIRNEFGCTLTMAQLFNSPTIAALAAWLDSEKPVPAAMAPVPTAPRGIPVPLSATQQRMWVAAQFEEESIAYTTAMALRLEGPVNVDALRDALQKIVDRHEILRTTYHIEECGTLQTILAKANVTLPVLDLTATTDSEEHVGRIVREESRKPFDLSKHFPFRALVCRLGCDDHVLLLTIHHIAFDGWSKSVLLRELSSIYEAKITGRAPVLPELPVQYADYVLWRTRIEQEAEPELIAFWKEQLDGIPALLEMPTDRPRPARQTFVGSEERRQLPPELSTCLSTLSRKHSATLFMTLAAAFQVLLSRYSGQTDICIGIPTAQRARKELEPLIGCFINTLVLRADLSADSEFTQFLGRLRQTAVAAYDHQDLPFEKLIDALHAERHPSHLPVVQVLFQLRNHPETEPAIHGLTVSMFESDPGTSKCDLTLDIVEAREGLLCILNYNTDLFDPSTARRILRHYQTLLEGVVLRPNSRVSELPLMSEEETRQILQDWNSNVLMVPGKSIPELFAEQAARTPAHIAVVSGNMRLTYGQLNERANRWASFLISQGTAPETRVAVCMERTPEMIIALLAILKAGGAYVPLDPTYPIERLRFVLENSRASMAITKRDLVQRLPKTSVQVLEWEATQEQISQQPTEDICARTDPANAAYVIYTSGSTGAPKGITVPHSSMSNFIAAYQKLVDIHCGDRTTCLFNVSSDPTVLELWPFLTAGASIYLPEEKLKYQPDALCDWIIDQEITQCCLPTPLAELVFRVDWKGLKHKCRLRQLTVGGEALLTYPPADFPCEVFNAYGPTENTVATTIDKISTEARQPCKPSIGRPLPNVRVYVLDRNLHLCPVGTNGELYIAGNSLARSYVDAPHLTAQSFIPDPFSDVPGSRMYSTGDCVRYLADGRIDFIGRRDNQVKVHGFRIELGEIEAVLRSHPSVKEGAVLVVEKNSDKELVAFVVAEGDMDALKRSLTSHLEAALPRYMVPSSVAILHAMPLSASGKINRKALLSTPVPARPEEDASYPSSSAEMAIARIWQALLRQENGRIRSDISFFHLGGHSLLAGQMIYRINQQFGTELSIRTAFEYPTIAELAGAVMQARPASKEHRLVRVPRSPEGQPLSSAQLSLWVVSKHEPQSTAYNLPMAFDLRGPLQTSVLIHCLQSIYQRHESFRTRFIEVEGEPRQLVAEQAELTVPVIEMSEEQARMRIAHESIRIFDLEKGPVFFAEILRLGPERHFLSLNVHHIVCDAWSVEIFLKEFSLLYAAKGDASSLPDVQLQYVDYSDWQVRRTLSPHYESAKQFWRSNLETAPGLLELPRDFARPARLPHKSGIFRFKLPASLRSSLKKLGREQGCTFYMVLFAAFQTLLFRHTSQEDIVVGTPVTTRDKAELEQIVGYFVNLVALRTKLSGSASFLDVLADVKRTVIEGFEHQEVIFADVVDILRPERSPTYSPVFQMVFALQEGLLRELVLPEMSCTPIEHTSQLAKFDLMLMFRDAGEELSGTVEFSAELFARTTIESIVHRFKVLLSAIAQTPSLVLPDLSILTEAERRELIINFNRSALPGETYNEAGIHELFEAQAAKTPDHVAIVWGDTSLTYRSLDDQTNALALALNERGIKPGDYVGVCLSRSHHTVVAVLGVLKSGAAYVPLDPAYPENRTAAIVQDADLKVFVCDRENSRKQWRPDATVIVIPDALSAESRSSGGNSHCTHKTNLSHIIYTSGSTGRPKGVMIEHRSVVALLEWCRQTYSVEDLARVLFSTSISFDLSVFEMWAPLTRGGTVVVAENALALCEKDRTYDLTLINTVPSALREIVDQGGIAAGVRVVNVAGEPLPANLVNDVFQRTSVERVYNLYGPTEDTTYSTFACYRGPISSEPAIGRPLPGTQLFVVGAHKELMPLGCVGELWIGGAGLARGYVDNPELTQERFVTAALSEDGPQRFYRTGDLVRWSPEGELFFLGRKDHQVKVRGYRIELGEIEAHLLQHELVDDCVVLAREDQPGNKQLVAYVATFRSAAGQNSGLISELIASCRRQLPEYMVPSAYVQLDRLPLSRNGKVDRKALPAPDAAAIVHASYAPPTTDLETRLCNIWESVLKVSGVGIHDDFFSLGGNSLLAIRIVALINKELGIDLPVREVLASKTVQNLALEIISRENQPLEHLGLERMEGTRVLAAYPQVGTWGVAHREGFETFFNMTFALEIRGELDSMALRNSLQSLIERHESLRTRFTERNGEIFLAVDQQQEIAFRMVDISGGEEEFSRARVQALQEKEAEETFDLENGPLLRAKLLQCSPRKSILLLTMHHLISDGWSVNILKKELDAQYRAHVTGEEPALAPMHFQYSDYAFWSRKWHQSQTYKQQAEYWIKKLGSFNSRPFPTDTKHCSSTHHRMRYKDLCLSADELERLSGYCTRNGVTLYVLLMTTFHASIYLFSGLKRLMVCSPVAGRDRSELEGSIGLYVNMINILSELSGNPTLAEFISQMRETVYEALANSSVQMTALFAHPDFRMPEFPGFVFNYIQFPNDAEWRLGDLDVVLHERINVERPCLTALDLTFANAQHGLRGHIGYDIALFREDTVDTIVSWFRHILHLIVTNPDTTFSAISASITGIRSGREHKRFEAAT